jgi:hypothetical protein
MYVSSQQPAVQGSARRCLFSCGDVMCLTPSLDVPAASSRRWTDAGSSPTQFHVPRSGVGDVSACHITVELCVYRGAFFAERMEY